ncbi:MAG TPA: MFS transporter, partial [Actinomycetota bacterium]|nr:MFS transporter [Actinomycetota bacterium]
MSDPRARLTWTVFTGVALGSTGLGAAFTVAPLIAADIADSSLWSGLPGASALIGTAAGAAMLSRLMAARGRRAGLALGWALGLVGALVAVAAARSETLPLFFAGLFLIGVGHSSNQLGRFAAADMQAPQRRGFVLGWIVWAGTIGAVVGPGLLGI